MPKNDYNECGTCGQINSHLSGCPFAQESNPPVAADLEAKVDAAIQRNQDAIRRRNEMFTKPVAAIATPSVVMVGALKPTTILDVMDSAARTGLELARVQKELTAIKASWVEQQKISNKLAHELAAAKEDVQTAIELANNYGKQLTAARAECEELKKELGRQTKETVRYYELERKSRAECEKLKDALTKIAHDNTSKNRSAHQLIAYRALKGTK